MLMMVPTSLDVVTSFGQQPVLAVAEHFEAVTCVLALHFLHVAHAALVVAVHAFDKNLPVAHVAHLVQVVSFFSWHAIRVYVPSLHTLQSEHSRSEVSEGWHNVAMLMQEQSCIATPASHADGACARACVQCAHNVSKWTV